MQTTSAKRVITPPEGKIHRLPWPYSHGIAVGNLLFIAGQVALDEDEVRSVYLDGKKVGVLPEHPLPAQGR